MIAGESVVKPGEIEWNAGRNRMPVPGEKR